jgi:outer membrane protein assembly factor BamB
MRWNDHLYAIGADIGMVLGDPRTGHILGPTALVLRPNDVFVRVCEDVLLVQDRNGDPFRAYDLVREEWLWERNLLADMKAQYRAWDDVPLPLIKSSGPGLLVCRRGKGLFGIGLRDGQLRWGVDGFCRTINPHQSRVYVWGGTRPELHRDRFLCLDAGTGASIYEVPIEVKGPRPGALSDRHIVYTTRDGWMAAFRLSDGARVWSHQHKQWLGGPVIAGNRLFVGAEDGYLYVFEGDL